MAPPENERMSPEKGPFQKKYRFFGGVFEYLHFFLVI